ncbi:MAG: hypothetical protein Q4E05_05760 [Pseudoclavibacter sp.]|nr:hypothetical protein [Pseudoclavibacter sp.]
MTTTPFITRAMLLEHLTVQSSVEALRSALHEGVANAGAPATQAVRGGTLRVAHAEGLGYAGTQLSGAAERAFPGRERVSGSYVLMDGETLAPLAILDGPALSEVRACAAAALAADALAPHAASRLVVVGAGPLARTVIAAMRRVRPIQHVVIAGRSGAEAEGVAAFAAECGMQARVSEAMSLHVAVPQADVVVVTDAGEPPRFPAGIVADGACVVAIGEPGGPGTGLDPELLRTAVVAVDDASAAAEAGDVRAAIEAGAVAEGSLVPIGELVLGRRAPSRTAPNVYVSVGSAWQDLAIAVLARRTVPSQRRKYVPGTAAQAQRYL